MIAASVYLLCSITSILCAYLLYSKYRSSRHGLLFWSSLCFFGLALNNILLFVDIVLFPKTDLSIVRTIPALIGYFVLIWGFVWELT